MTARRSLDDADGYWGIRRMEIDPAEGERIAQAAMHSLALHGKRRPSELAQDADTSQQRADHVLRHLMSHGLVSCVAWPAHRGVRPPKVRHWTLGPAARKAVVALVRWKGETPNPEEGTCPTSE